MYCNATQNYTEINNKKTIIKQKSKREITIKQTFKFLTKNPTVQTAPHQATH